MTSAHKLALIRYAVLLDLETNRKLIQSQGLIDDEDLIFIFPRSSKLAAIKHAEQVASSIFDERIPDQGVHHLFRLPATYESQIHQAYLSGEIFNTTDEDDGQAILKTISKSKPQPENALDGPQPLGALDLTKPATIKKIASIYGNGLAANKLTIPFFSLS